MPDVTVNIPQTFLDLYNLRRASYNAYATPRGLRPMPLANRATLERFARDYMKGLILNESDRLDPGDGSISDADRAAMAGV